MISMEDTATMTFVCSELSTTMFQKLSDQRKSNRFCDLTLHVNNRIVKAHRNVLACSSPYFDSILKHHKIIREQLVITCLDAETFTLILNYMYTGEITIEQSNVAELLKLADHFIITKVIEYCIEFLGTKLGLHNCLFTYFLTQRFRLKHLGNIVENWIASHIDDVCEGAEIAALADQELADFFKNKNFVLSTGRALRVLAKWVLQNVERREIHFDKLIKCFHANSLEPSEVFKHLDTCILYNKSELCTYKFLDYLIQNNWMLSNFKTRYDILHLKYSAQLLTCTKTQPEKPLITVTERHDSVLIKPKLRNKKQLILKRLMLFGLKPSLRLAALKMLACRQRAPEEEVEEAEEPIGVKCPICFAQINDSLLLEQHLALSHAKDVTYKCGVCAFVCQYHGDYLNHMKSHFPGPPFKCDYCDYSGEQIGRLIAHRAQHLDESAHQCTFCPYKCRLKQSFAAHLKLHAAEKSHRCGQCPKTFKFKPNLDAHILTHENEKALTCESCGFGTKFLSHMIAHKRIHAGDIYRCSYPHCKYSSAKKSQLASHAKSHNGVRPHSCGVCGRGFMEKSHLVRHERIHLEEKPFKCSSCDYASSRRDKLKEHFTRHHGENASAKVPYKARPMRNTTTRTAKNQGQESGGPVNGAAANAVSFPAGANNAASTAGGVVNQPLGNEIQDLILQHHQNHTNSAVAAAAANLSAINSNYHGHFGDPNEFHHHNHAHNIHNQILGSGGHNQRNGNQHVVNNNIVNHHNMLRGNHGTATSTAAAVAAAMMLDPRFHHNGTVPYHPSSTPVSMAMAAVQSSQQIQASSQHSDYPPTLQNCMTLF